MSLTKITLTRFTIRWHRLAGWVGGIALILFGLSGISHPLMTWFGPQQAVFFPPQGQFSRAEIAAIPDVLSTNQIYRAQLVKVTPTVRGNLLQVSGEDGLSRRYFDLNSGVEYPNFDRHQGEWLARYYTGFVDTPIATMTLQTHFDSAYPPVNRLLPVWRVTFDREDNLSVFVHTELNALASITNDTKTLQQTLFRNFHSFQWLSDWEPLRVAVLSVLTLALAALSISGMAMVFALPSRRISSGKRRWHRHLAFALWLPLLAFSISGFYHLLHHAGEQQPPGMAYGKPIAIDSMPLIKEAEAPWLDGRPLNSITLITDAQGQMLYRLAEPNGNPGQRVEHHGRFDGTATEKAARFINATTGNLSPVTDEEMATFAAAQYLAISPHQITRSEIITRFSSEYDFRNKRLPVWRVDYQGERSGSVFIDPANLVLVDSTNNADRFEGLSFSHLHKWNFLTAFTGREIRDSLMVLVIIVALAFAVLGFSMLRQRKRSPLKNPVVLIAEG